MNNINIGDHVRVKFNNAQVTLCHRAIVEYKPIATGDSWIFTDIITSQTHYVSEGCTITKLEKS